MATNYPSGLDSLSNPAGTDALSTGHAAQHANANDAVEAIEAELGTDPAGASATVKARFEAIEANSWVTSARIADGTVTGTDIASGTVTSANLVDGTIVNADVSGTAAIDKTKISGTAVTVADTGTVTSTMIADGTIVNADIATAAAVAPSKIDQARVTFSDAAAVCAATTRKLAQVGTMSASRTVTLPAANAVAAGTEIVVCDESGSVTSTNTIVIARAGSDTVNGTTSVSIGAAYGMRRLISDGTSKWSVDGGVVRISDTGTVTSTMIADATIVNADVAAAAAIDVAKLSGVMASATVGNMLTYDQATAETTTTCYVIHAQHTATITADYVYQGANSLKLVQSSTSAANLAVPLAGAKTVPVTPGVPYTASAMVYQSVNTGRLMYPTLYWYKANGTSLSDITPTVNGGNVFGAASWQRLLVTGVAPSDAAYARVIHNIPTTGAVAGDTLHFDALGIWQGAGGLWSPPGSPTPDLGTYADESVGRRIFTWDTVNARWQQTYGDTGQRTAGSSLGSGWTGTYDLISRVGNLVTINMILAKTGSNTVANGETLATLPAGFRPQTTTYNVLGILSGVSGATVFQLATTGALTYFGATTGTITNPTAYLTFTFRTADAWPSSLPGSASGSIPT